MAAMATGITVTVTASTDGTNYSTIGSSTTGADTISFSGTYSNVRVTQSGMTISMPSMSVAYAGSTTSGRAALAMGLNNTTARPIAVDASGNVGMTPGTGTTTSVNIASVGSNAVVSAGINGVMPVGGTVADGVTSGNTHPILISGVDGGAIIQALRVDNLGGITGTVNFNTSNLAVNVAQIAGTTTITAGVAGLQAVGGAAATGAALSGNPVRIGISDGTNAQNWLSANTADATTGTGIAATNPGLVTFSGTYRNWGTPTGRADNVSPAPIGMMAGYLWNGSTEVTTNGWDRPAGMPAFLLGTTSKGVAAVGPVARSTTSGGVATFQTVPGCDTGVSVSVAGGTTVLIVSGVAAQHVRVCHSAMSISLAGTVQVISGTGAICGSGTTNLTPAMNLIAGTPFVESGSISEVYRTAATGDSLCVAAVTGTVNGHWRYVIY